MHRITRSLVLSGSDFGESDRIITLFSRSLGKVTVIAKGAKRSQKRFVNTLESPGLIRAVIRRGRGSLPLLEAADLLDPFPGIRQSWRSFALASLWLEVTERLLKPGLKEPELFDLLALVLSGLNRGLAPERLHLFFLLRTLIVAGFGPELWGCRRCQKRVEGKQAYFSPEDGGLICLRCYQGGAHSLPWPLLKYLRDLARASLWPIEALNIDFRLLRHGERLLETMLFRILGERPVAFKVYKDLCEEEYITSDGEPGLRRNNV
ncbi:DNA repair protein RecO [Thermosulfuriphilus ammonigenes]|uniref:DNA repair protein RecO n=2 Tax=Thermosulfuriphilus ammonigenes TaxID=1936021 RepID=A0A6G7PT50_9BACT|nr:DNA repair protein RecO (recombination protein O) [Thermosulfuriphilus ammonigenes]QIJ70854.1 DNA repair protein RecO [Thermosulfuriphilus ammonigenes]